MVALQVGPVDAVVGGPDARLGFFPRLTAVDAEVGEIGCGGGLLPVLLRGAPAGGADDVIFGLFYHLARVSRTVVGADARGFLETEGVADVRVRGQTLRPPTFYRDAPRTIGQWESVGLLMVVDAA